MTEIKILLDRLASPARRAILGTGVKSLEELSRMSSAQVSSLHGIGRNALGTIETVLAENGLNLDG